MVTVATEQIARLLQDKLAEGHSAFLHVVSGSMTPLLQIDDQIEVQNSEVQALETMDLLLLRAPAALFSHRFWGFVSTAHGERLVTRGDRPLSYDPLWGYEKLLGKIVGWRRQEAYYSLLKPAGQQLNQKLGHLAQNELQLFSRLYNEPGLAQLPVDESAQINFTQVNRSRLLTALIRRLFLARATLLTRYYLPQLRS